VNLHRGTKVLTGRVFAGAVFAVSLSAQAGVIVYDNTTLGFETGRSFTALEQGDEASLARTARTVTERLIGVTRQGSAGAADMQVRMYENDGAGGRPGRHHRLHAATLIGGAEDAVLRTRPGNKGARPAVAACLE